MISPADAEEFTSSLESIGDGWFRQLALGVKLGVHEALGLSRREWSDRIGVTLRSTVERREAVAELAAEGLSNRAIADIVGVGKETVRRDIGSFGPPSSSCQQTDDDGSGPNEPLRLIDDPSVEGLKDAIRQNNAAVAARRVDIPDDKFRTLVIDPPWPMTKIERDCRPNQVEFDYPTMSESELESFGDTINDLAHDDCHLFMWTTPKFLPMAWRLIEGYGFKYVLTMVWHKPGGFQPTRLPQFNCEFIVYARKGTPKFIDTKGFSICFNAPRREHSRKPDEFYDIISLVTAGPRIDVFSREPREGFAQYGNEINKFSEAV